MKWLHYVAYTTLAITILYLLLNCNEKSNTFYKYDTLTKVVSYPVIKLDSIKGRVRIVRDTIIKTKPFESRIDTLIKGDTISFAYLFPENYHSFTYSKRRDTLKMPILVQEESTYKNILLTSGIGFILGYIIGDYNE
jgi:hypothetical protein